MYLKNVHDMSCCLKKSMTTHVYKTVLQANFNDPKLEELFFPFLDVEVG